MTGARCVVIAGLWTFQSGPMGTKMTNLPVPVIDQLHLHLHLHLPNHLMTCSGQLKKLFLLFFCWGGGGLFLLSGQFGWTLTFSNHNVLFFLRTCLKTVKTRGPGHMLLQLNMTKWCKTEYHSQIQNTNTPHKSKSESETESVCPGFHFHFCQCWWSCKSLQGKIDSFRSDPVPSPSWSSWPHRAEISPLLCQGYTG